MDDLGTGREHQRAGRLSEEIRPTSPDAYQHLGDLFFAQDQYDEALACFETALSLDPDRPDAHNNAGITLARMGRLREAIHAYDRALALNPGHHEARKNRGITNLILGNYREGFADYESRWHCNGFVLPEVTQPMWRGEPIAGKTILLIPEQGLGDTIQCIRFASRVKALGATVVFRCPSPLLKLFAGFPAIDHLVLSGEPLPEYHVHSPLMSLPAILGIGLEDVPAIHPVPYLRADPALARRWSDRLGPRARGEFRVGICWQGSPTQVGDHFRSAPLAAFAVLAAVPGVKLISLQKGHGVEQIPPFADRVPILDFGDELDRDSGPFQDTAALMSILDLVVTIDSALVHLAGALGVPTWLALSNNTDWRWLAGREDSPWYPTVRIYRHPERHNWDDVFQRIARALSDLLGNQNGGPIVKPIPVEAAAASSVLRASRAGTSASDLGTGWEHQRAGRLAEAEACYRRFLDGHPNHSQAWATLGVVLFKQEKYDEAIACYLRSLELRPEAVDVLTNLGVAYAVKQDFTNAEQTLRRAIAVRPLFIEAHRNLGHALRDQGKFAEAASVYQQANGLKPHDSDILGNLSHALDMANRAAGAIEPLREAATLAPKVLSPRQRIASSLAAAGRLDEAEAAFSEALVLDPTNASIHNSLGIVRAKRKRFTQAEASLREAIRLNPQLVEAYQNLGNIFRNQDRYEEALACYAVSLRLRPNVADIHSYVGFALGRLGRCEEALQAYDRTLALEPAHAHGRKNRAIMKLALGHFVEGFAEYDASWRLLEETRIDFPQPVWKGEPIAGKRILLVPEQGLGDMIQFIRFAPRVKAMGATVILCCYKPLLKMFGNIPGVDLMVPEREPLPPFDVYVPLLSLPAVFRIPLEKINVDYPVPYLAADPKLVEQWRDRLGPRPPGELRVGICWQGNPDHPSDRFRSAPLEAFLPLAAVPGVRFISLQKNHGLEQIAPLGDRLPMLDFRDSTRFEETAALMSLLDLVITVDSAPVHLAGALGAPTWLVLSRYTEWRWLADRDDSPWYPSVRVFRQRELRDWDDVFQRMATALAELAESPRHGKINNSMSD